MIDDTKPENPTAFPVLDDKQSDRGLECMDAGMSLLDYFAAKALPDSLMWHGMPGGDDNYKQAVARAYDIAQAMLIERHHRANPDKPEL